MNRTCLLILPLLASLAAFAQSTRTPPARPLLSVAENGRYLEYQNGEPFFWLGGTSWGMAEWLDREGVVHYLENRKKKGFTVVQVCAFWGRREENPVRFTLNPSNAYGFKAFAEENGVPDAMKPATVRGGTPQVPNDYWDHVDFIIQEAGKRRMMVALLPVWGRRYVNATHAKFSAPFFSLESMRQYGTFLGERLKGYDNLIWVLGGDVKADDGGNYLGHYRAMAEGILEGATGERAGWNEQSPLWDKVLMTYHPDGTPLRNSSEWFHHDPWLDFNMIETYTHRDSVYRAVAQDYRKSTPVKPTVLGEPDYEGAGPGPLSEGIHMRRQAFHSFFAGAAGFTYGGKIDREGNGPLWSPYEGWKRMLDMEGAQSMEYVKQFCLENGWPAWKPDDSLLPDDAGEGEWRKVAASNPETRKYFVYFPDASPLRLDLGRKSAGRQTMRWYDAKTGQYTAPRPVPQGPLTARLPGGWSDGVLVLSLSD